MEQQISEIKDRVLDAVSEDKPLKLIGGNSKAFLGRDITGMELNLSDYTGIISYEPTELYITVRAGTLLSEVKQVLSEQNQMLAFEPPEVNAETTIGGVIATGLSGPRRPYVGSVRDFVLGVKCINGLAKEMAFGGQVMKNVAGYDLSRLLTGSYGTLGIIYEVTLKVLPLPEFELTGFKTLSKNSALDIMSKLFSKSLPVSAACYYNGQLIVRFSGNEKVVKDSIEELEMDVLEGSEQFWSNLRDYKLNIFNSDKPVWRLSVPVTSNVEILEEETVIDWGGAQYWLASERTANEIFAMAQEVGGSAFLFRGGDRNGDIFQSLPETLFNIQKNLKQAFDPHRILNREKMYKGL